jgi:hypothetical protein
MQLSDIGSPHFTIRLSCVRVNRTPQSQKKEIIVKSIKNALLKSCEHKPFLVLALILGVWINTAVTAKAQVIQMTEPPHNITFNSCDGVYDGFAGTDTNTNATYVILDTGAGYTFDPLYFDGDVGDWFMEEVQLLEGNNPMLLSDDQGTAQGTVIYVDWEIPEECD